MDGSQPGTPAPNFYELLAVARDASGAEIARAYRRKARELHPDSRPQELADPQKFRALAEAYEVLSDPARRSDYDRSLPRPARPAHGSWPPGPARLHGSARLPGPQIWASPVWIEPAESPPWPAGRQPPDDVAWLAAVTELVDWHLGRQWDWRW